MLLQLNKASAKAHDGSQKAAAQDVEIRELEQRTQRQPCGKPLERAPSRDRWGNPLHERHVKVIEGTVIAKINATAAAKFAIGDRIFHQKFGNGTVAEADGEKLTIDFDRAGRKRVLDSFVQPM